MTLRLLSIFMFFLSSWVWSGTGFLTIDTEPRGAEVFVKLQNEAEYQFMGKTPLTQLKLEEGVYKIEIRFVDYDTLHFESVAIFDNRIKEISEKLSYRYAYASIKTLPESSTVFMDKINVGITPHENSLILPGEYLFRIEPKSTLFKPFQKKVAFKAKDSLLLDKHHLYRSKTFEKEHLSLAPWHLQFESGLQRKKYTGRYIGKEPDPCDPLAAECTVPKTESSSENFELKDIKTEFLYPLTLRLAVPNNIEFHLHLPFILYNPSPDSSSIFGPGNLKLGAKYTLRKYNLGFGANYIFQSGKENNTQNYNSLEVVALGLINKSKFQVFGNILYKANFSPDSNKKINIGDEVQAYVRAGYLMNIWTPYLAVDGVYTFSDLNDGQDQQNSGYLITPELGVICEVNNTLSFQAGVPFTVFGKENPKYWAFHASFALTFPVQ